MIDYPALAAELRKGFPPPHLEMSPGTYMDSLGIHSLADALEAVGKHVKPAPAQPQKPTIGRIVHYYAYLPANMGIEGAAPRAGIITNVHPAAVGPNLDMVTLCILGTSGMSFKQHIRYSEEPASDRWTWPPRT